VLTFHLTTTELALLRYLVEKRERPVPRGELLSQVWGRPPTSTSRVPDDTMRRLRAKIEADSSAPRHLITVQGEGYRFIPWEDGSESEGFDGSQTLALETGVVDLQTGVVHGEQGEVRLTTKERSLLGYLSARPGLLVTRQTLLTEVWGYAPQVTSRAADDTMRRLRIKVEREPHEPRHLLTVHGGGYRFVPSEPLVDDALDYGAVRIDFSRHIVAWRDGREEALTPTEASLLSALASNNGAVVSRRSLLRRVKKRRQRANRRSLDTMIQRLRHRIEPDPSRPRLIINVRGQGYRLAPPPPPAPPPENLPSLRGALIGRTRELIRLDALLSRPGITAVVGLGGMGKTTLVLQSARRALAQESTTGAFGIWGQSERRDAVV